MRRRKTVIAAVLVLICLPVALVVVEAVLFRVQNRSNGTIVSSGQTREYLLYVPRSYDRTKPTPLVISMHAAALWPVTQRDASQWNTAADSQGFIVVYPAGIGGPGLRVWHVDRGPGLMRDAQFISDLIDTLEVTYNVDSTRIYANGLSNGGGMAFALSCLLSDRIAAVGLVAAALTLPWSGCPDHRPVPMIAFHGTADRFTPYRGGWSPVASDPFPSIPNWTAMAARRNRCGADPVESAPAADVTRLEYRDCADDAAVVLYTIRGGSHQWPGGKPLAAWMVGPVSNAVDATSEMWAFFRDHPLREARPPAPP